MGFLDMFKRKKKEIISKEEEERIKKQTFELFEKFQRKASIAVIGGSKPTYNKLKSRFGGNFLMKETEEWPKWNNRYLDSILQINVSELPYVPEEIDEYKLITIFIDVEEVPFDQPIGKGWEIRFYKELEELVEKSKPKGKTKLKSFEINWNITETELPSYEDAEGEMDLNLFNKLENCIDLFYANSSNHELTKVAGWPSIIQHELEMDAKNMIFQIGSENKVNLNWLDGGTVYIGCESGEWKFECQFY